MTSNLFLLLTTSLAARLLNIHCISPPSIAVHQPVRLSVSAYNNNYCGSCTATEKKQTSGQKPLITYPVKQHPMQLQWHHHRLLLHLHSPWTNNSNSLSNPSPSGQWTRLLIRLRSRWWSIGKSNINIRFFMFCILVVVYGLEEKEKQQLQRWNNIVTAIFIGVHNIAP